MVNLWALRWHFSFVLKVQALNKGYALHGNHSKGSDFTHRRNFFAREFHREVYILFCFTTSKGKEFVSGKMLMMRVKEEEKCILAYVFMQ